MNAAWAVFCSEELCRDGALYKIERYLGACRSLLFAGTLVMYSPDAGYRHILRCMHELVRRRRRPSSHCALYTFCHSLRTLTPCPKSTRNKKQVQHPTHPTKKRPAPPVPLSCAYFVRPMHHCGTAALPTQPISATPPLPTAKPTHPTPWTGNSDTAVRYHFEASAIILLQLFFFERSSSSNLDHHATF